METRLRDHLARFSDLPVLTYWTYAALWILENHANGLTGAGFGSAEDGDVGGAE